MSEFSTQFKSRCLASSWTAYNCTEHKTVPILDKTADMPMQSMPNPLSVEDTLSTA